MRPLTRARRRALWNLGLLALAAVLASPGLPQASASPSADGAREPLSVEPLSIGVHFSYRTMQGMESRVISPSPTYDDLNDVAFAPDGHLALMVGHHLTVVAWDPASQTSRILRNGTAGDLQSVAWSDDSSQALAVGGDGALVRYTAAGVEDLPPHGPAHFNGVAFVPGAGFLAVGSAGAMFFLNGSTRTNVTSPTTNHLRAVAWNPVAGLAVAVGDGGTVIEVTAAGAATLVAPVVPTTLTSVAFESDTGRGLITGAYSVLLSYAGGTLANESHAAVAANYTDITLTTSAKPAAIALFNNTTSAILFTNATFSSLVPLTAFPPYLESLARNPAQDYVVGTGLYGMAVQAFENGTYANISSPVRRILQGASWRDSGDLALMVGFNGTVLLYNRTSDVTLAVPSPSQTAAPRSVSWAANGSTALIVGPQVFWRFDLGTLSISEPIGATTLELQAVAFRPLRPEATVVGGSGFIGQWDGVNLTRISSASLGNYFYGVRWHKDGAGVGDYAYVVGGNLVARVDPPATVTTSPRPGTYFGVDFLGDQVWIAGDPHQVMVYDPNTGIWDNLSLPGSLDLVHMASIAAAPDGQRLLVVGNQSLAMYVNRTKAVRFVAPFSSVYRGVEYNPTDGQALLVGGSALAVLMREGTFPNLAPTARISSPGNGTNWTHVDTVFFDATASDDIDGDTLRISWWDNVTGFLTAAGSFGTQLAPGDHTITAFVDDGQGHNVSASVALHVVEAPLPPVAQVSAPAPNATFADDEDITFNGATSYDPNGADTLTFAWSSDLDGAMGAGPVFVGRLSAGTHLVTLRVTDSTGRFADASLVVHVVVGNFPPVPVMASPTAGAEYHSNIPVELNASGTADPDSTGLSYEWLLDSAWIAAGALNWTLVPEGQHLMTLRVSDGQKTAQVDLVFLVRAPLDLPPRFVTVNPANGSVLTAIAVFNGTVEPDAVGPVRFVEFLVEGGDWQSALLTGTTWTATLETRDYPNGPVNVTFRASDGTNATTQTRRYTIDNPFVNAPPTVDILTPQPGALVRGEVSLAGGVGDDGASSVAVEYRVAGGAWRNATMTSTSAWSASFDTVGMANGPVTVEVRAFDGFNYSALAVLVVNVDNPPPPRGFLPGPTALVAIAGLACAAWVARGALGRRR